jgi:hypothetical protein
LGQSPKSYFGCKPSPSAAGYTLETCVSLVFKTGPFLIGGTGGIGRKVIGADSNDNRGNFTFIRFIVRILEIRYIINTSPLLRYGFIHIVSHVWLFSPSAKPTTGSVGQSRNSIR